MASNKQSQIFDIDLEEVEALKNIVGATEQEMKLAYNRALNRTARTFAKLSKTLIKDDIQARNVKFTRKRLKSYKNRGSNGLDNFKLWVGLNPVPTYILQGKLKWKRGGPASFTPKASNLESITTSRGFVLKVNGKKLMFERKAKGKSGYEIVKEDIHKPLEESIEAEIFRKIPEIFFHHYESDLKSRIKMRDK
ncbi:MAG: hypothetical protein ACK5NC_11625 [Vibrio sp.]